MIIGFAEMQFLSIGNRYGLQYCYKLWNLDIPGATYYSLENEVLYRYIWIYISDICNHQMKISDVEINQSSIE